MTLQRVLGDLHVELAKKCMQSARNRRMNRSLKATAWDHARRHLSAAEAAFSRALSVDPTSSAVRNSLDYVAKLQAEATTPRKRRASPDDLDRYLEED